MVFICPFFPERTLRSSTYRAEWKMNRLLVYNSKRKSKSSRFVYLYLPWGSLHYSSPKWLNRHSKPTLPPICHPFLPHFKQIDIIKLIIFQTSMFEKNQTAQSILEQFQKCCTTSFLDIQFRAAVGIRKSRFFTSITPGPH